MRDPYIAYMITEGFCLIFAITSMLQLSNNLGSEHEVLQLKNLVYSYIFMIICDMPWALNAAGVINLDIFSAALFDAAVRIAVVLGCYFWFEFVIDRLQPKFATAKYFKYFENIPLAVACFLDISSIFNGWTFTVDLNGGYSQGPLFMLHAAIDYGYLMVPTVLAIMRMVSAKSWQRKSEYLLYTVYMVIPLLSGIFEDEFPTTPILALSIFMVINVLFLSIQNMQIFSDALTGLNNRRRLNQYLEERISSSSEEHPVVLLMMDINDFKAINDGFGHVEGDNALRDFASALRSACSGFDAFIARYGGDEFCLVADASKHSPEDIEAKVEEAIKRVHPAPEDVTQAYDLSASMGYALCDDPDSSPEGLIRLADAKLYMNKRKWHQEHLGR